MFQKFVQHRFASLAVCFAFFLALAGSTRAPSPPAAGLQSFTGERLLTHIRTLSSNQFEGRGPGSNGEKLTINYLQDQFRQMGLEPGNPDDTYLQDVALVGITPDPNMELTFTGRGGTLRAAFEKDFVAWTKRMVESVNLDADMVFVGYGVQAPEYKWDDFKGMDVKGKVIVVLINDPPVPDETMFGGKAMTYYGRWTYKFEKAAELGAAGCLIVHETEPAGYPWAVVRDSNSAEKFTLSSPNKNMDRVAVEGWISHEKAKELFRAVGQDFDALKKAAGDIKFTPSPSGRPRTLRFTTPSAR